LEASLRPLSGPGGGIDAIRAQIVPQSHLTIQGSQTVSPTPGKVFAMMFERVAPLPATRDHMNRQFAEAATPVAIE
jgi:hypothetical protein